MIKTFKKEVLDHGMVRLVSYMQPAIQSTKIWLNTAALDLEAGTLPIETTMAADYSDWSGDLEVIRNARVSYDAAWRAGEDDDKDAKLLNYLMKNRHSSPFEAMTFTFEIRAPIFVVRQWHRHRIGWSYNELSARYAELPEVFYIPKAEEIGRQSKSNKQMRDLAAVAGVTPEDLQFIEDLQTHSEDGFRLYKKHLAAGVPRELARLFLGLNTYTHMFATCNLLSLFHFCGLRMHAHAQREIQVYAGGMLELAEPIAPVAVAAFRKHVLGEDPPPTPVVDEPRTVVGVAKGIRKHF